MGEIVLNNILILIVAAIGAFDIRTAVKAVIEHKYGLFGWCVMMAVWMSAMIFELELRY